MTYHTETYPELLATTRRSRVVENFQAAGGIVENTHFSLTLDDANIIRALLIQERDFGLVLTYPTKPKPGNEMAAQSQRRLEANIGRLSDLLLNKF